MEDFKAYLDVFFQPKIGSLKSIFGFLKSAIPMSVILLIDKDVSWPRDNTIVAR